MLSYQWGFGIQNNDSKNKSDGKNNVNGSESVQFHGYKTYSVFGNKRHTQEDDVDDIDKAGDVENVDDNNSKNVEAIENKRGTHQYVGYKVFAGENFREYAIGRQKGKVSSFNPFKSLLVCLYRHTRR